MGKIGWVWLNRIGRILKIGLIVTGAVLFALYAVLLVAEAYSGKHAKRILSKLEQLRPGDSLDDFKRAVVPCKVELNYGSYSCKMTPAPYTEEVWLKVWKILGYRADYLFLALNRIGLRYWKLAAEANVRDGRITHSGTDLWVTGRYETLGASWEIGEKLPERISRLKPVGIDKRTFMSWYHIHSLPNGEGYLICATQSSTPQELGARHVNADCLLSLRGCEGLCELLPNVVPVLDDRERGFGCVEGVPPAKCQPKKQTPCQ